MAERIDFLYHGTSSHFLEEITSVSLCQGSYWGTFEVALYFARCKCKDVGGEPSIIRKSIEEFREAFIPDFNMIDFCILNEIYGIDGFDEKIVLKKWQRSKQDWQSSLALYKSAICTIPLAVSFDEIMIVKGVDNTTNLMSLC